jgi:hypothetical protein
MRIVLLHRRNAQGAHVGATDGGGPCGEARGSTPPARAGRPSKKPHPMQLMGNWAIRAADESSAGRRRQPRARAVHSPWCAAAASFLGRDQETMLTTWSLPSTDAWQRGVGREPGAEATTVAPWPAPATPAPRSSAASRTRSRLGCVRTRTSRQTMLQSHQRGERQLNSGARWACRAAWIRQGPFAVVVRVLTHPLGAAMRAVGRGAGTTADTHQASSGGYLATGAIRADDVGVRDTTQSRTPFRVPGRPPDGAGLRSRSQMTNASTSRDALTDPEVRSTGGGHPESEASWPGRTRRRRGWSLPAGATPPPPPCRRPPPPHPGPGRPAGSTGC